MGAQTSPAGRSYVSREVAKRLDRFVMRTNRVTAAKALGVSPETLETAIAEGRLLTTTVSRIVTALDREDEGDAPFFLGLGSAVNENGELLAVKFGESSIPGARVVDLVKSMLHEESDVLELGHRGDVVVQRRYARAQGWVTE